MEWKEQQLHFIALIDLGYIKTLRFNLRWALKGAKRHTEFRKLIAKTLFRSKHWSYSVQNDSPFNVEVTAIQDDMWAWQKIVSDWNDFSNDIKLPQVRWL